MNDSERAAADRGYLRSRVDWIQLPPFGLEASLAPLQLQLLMQAARDYQFQRFRLMGHAARAAYETFAQVDDLGIALSAMGLAAARLGDIPNAFDALTKAREGWPGITGHHYNCGVMALKFSEDLEVAEACFLSGLVRDATHGPSWLAVAVVRLLRANYEGCLSAAREAVRLGATTDGVAELCIAAALERLGRPVEWPTLSAEPGLAAPEAFAFPRAPSERTVLSVALGDREAVAAIRLAASVATVAPGWRGHLHLCNVSPAAAEAARAGAATVTTETVLTDPPTSLGERFGAIRLRTLAAFGARAESDLILAHPRLVFSADPADLLPEPDEGVALTLEAGLIWNQVGQDLIALRRGEAARTFLGELRDAATPSLWSKAPLFAGLVLWRAWQARPDVRVLGAAARARATIAEEPPPPPAPPARKQFNEVVPSRFGPMLLNSNDLYVSAGIRETGVWSAEEMELLEQLIEPGQTVLDVGANMGSHTLAFCNFVGPTGRVHAFEPQRVMYQAMVASVALNSWTNAHCHMKAVGAEAGRIRVPSVSYEEPSNFGMVTLAPDRARANTLTYLDAAEEEVEVVAIDGLNLPACHLIKIDVEGMELDVLRGAVCTIETHRPLIYMECQSDDRGRAALALLKSMGYSTWWHGAHGSPNVFGAPHERSLSVMGLRIA